jgi:succinyl-diaminopimelate desuccinylase
MSALVALLARLEAQPLDEGTAHFDASTLAITTIDCGNPATNVIPAKGQATVNIRFNDTHSGASLTDWLRGHAQAVQAETGVADRPAGADIGRKLPDPAGRVLGPGAAGGAGRDRGLGRSTPPRAAPRTRASSRRIARWWNSGWSASTMHQVDERVEVAQIGQLKAIYGRILRDYFA